MNEGYQLTQYQRLLYELGNISQTNWTKRLSMIFELDIKGGLTM